MCYITFSPRLPQNLKFLIVLPETLRIVKIQKYLCFRIALVLIKLNFIPKVLELRLMILVWKIGANFFIFTKIWRYLVFSYLVNYPSQIRKKMINILKWLIKQKLWKCTLSKSWGNEKPFVALLIALFCPK